MMTTITGKLFNADGTVANGSACVSWVAFQTHSVSIVGGQKVIAIVEGEFTVDLYPNITAQPRGIYYTVRMELDSGAVYEEYWIVPDLPAATIEQVRSSFPLEPGMAINPSQIAGSGAEPGMILAWNGSYWEGSYVRVDNVSPNWIRVAAGSSGTDFNISGSPVALGQELTINLPSASLTARGLVTTDTQSFAGEKSFANNVAVAGSITGPTITDIYSRIDTTGAGAVPVTRRINTTAPLGGGGPLSADLTLTADIAAIQTPWRQNVNAAGYNLLGATAVYSQNLMLAHDSYAPIVFQNAANQRRWQVSKDPEPDGPFRIHRYNDAGNYVSTPLEINRQTGEILLSHHLKVGSVIESLDGGFKFPDGTVQLTALSKAQAQTPWLQDINAAGYALNNLDHLVFQSTSYSYIRNDKQTYFDTGSGGTGDLVFRMGTGLATAMQIKNSGLIGIGISNPQSNLDVAGEIRANRQFYQFTLLGTDPTYKCWLNLDQAGGKMNFSAIHEGVGWLPLILGGGGNVAIGDITPAYKLDVAGVINSSSGLSINVAANSYAAIELAVAGSRRWMIGKNPESETGGNNGSHFDIYRYSDTGAYIGKAFCINRASGNVGIGSEAQPAYTLDVAGDTNIAGRIMVRNSATQADWWAAPVEIRATSSYPRITFYKGDIGASQLGMGDGRVIRTFDDVGTGYAPFTAAQIRSASGGYQFPDGTIQTTAQIQGPPGPPGAVNAVYTQEWAWNNQTAVPPNNSQVRSDTGNWTTATKLFIDNNSNDGADRSAALRTINAGDELRISQRTDDSRWQKWKVLSDSVDKASYWEVAVSPIEGSGTLPNSGTEVILNLIVTGVAVAQWYTGASAPPATLGHVGDMYLEGDGDIWTQLDPGGWTQTQTNIRGPMGPQSPWQTDIDGNGKSLSNANWISGNYVSAKCGNGLYLADQSFPTDRKYWRFYADQNVLVGQCENDSFVGTQWLAVYRTGSTPTKVTFPNGNVGIGVDPTEKLHVAGNILADNTLSVKNRGGATGNYLYLTGAADTLYVIAQSLNAASGTSIKFRTAGPAQDQLDRMTISMNGYVGIGTTGPQATLHVLGPSGGPAAMYGSGCFSGGDLAHQVRIGYDSNSGYGWVQSVAEGSGVTALAMNPIGGNVGVGTNNPQYKLDVAGQIQIKLDRTIQSAAGAQLRIVGSGTDAINPGIVFEWPTRGGVQVSCYNHQELWIRKYEGDGNGNLRAGDIYSFGRIGVGLSNPSFPLDVIGDVNITGLYRINGVPISTGGGGMAQTPWLSNIDAAGYGLDNASRIGIKAPNFPYWTLNRSNSALDEKLWAFQADQNHLDFFCPNDAWDATKIWLQVFRTGNTPTKMLFPNGNVGIGTADPQYTLDVNGKIYSSADIFGYGVVGFGSIGANLRYVAGVGYQRLLTDRSGLTFSPSSANTSVYYADLAGAITNIAVITSAYVQIPNVNLGIGPNASYKLDVGGDINLTGEIRKNGTVWNPQTPWLQDIEGNNKSLWSVRYLGFNDLSSGVAGGVIYVANASLQIDGSGAAAGRIGFWTNASGIPTMRLKGDGSVGIGTDNPQYKLDVAGDIRASQDIYVANSAPGTGNFRIDGYDNKLYLVSHNMTTMAVISESNAGFNGTVTATQFNGSAAGLTAGTVPIASLVAGDYSSKVTSGTYTINITGNASGSVNQNGYGGTGNWTTDFQSTPAHARRWTEQLGGTGAPDGNWYFIENMRHSNGSGYWGRQFAYGWEGAANQIWTRTFSNGSVSAGWEQLVRANGASWNLSVTGSSGSCTGNAATCTTASNSNQLAGMYAAASGQWPTAWQIITCSGDGHTRVGNYLYVQQFIHHGNGTESPGASAPARAYWNNGADGFIRVCTWQEHCNWINRITRFGTGQSLASTALFVENSHGDPQSNWGILRVGGAFNDVSSPSSAYIVCANVAGERFKVNGNGDVWVFFQGVGYRRLGIDGSGFVKGFAT